jgi:hypothetical protein
VAAVHRVQSSLRGLSSSSSKLVALLATLFVWRHRACHGVCRKRPLAAGEPTCSSTGITRDQRRSVERSCLTPGWSGTGTELRMTVLTQRSGELRNPITLSNLSGVDVQTINQYAKILARFEEGNSLRRHFDSGSGFWIASDARSSLPRVEASESADLDLVPGSQGTDDAVKYGTDDDVGFLPGHPNGLINLLGQIGPGHLEHPRRITKKSITTLRGALDAGSSRMVSPSESVAGTASGRGNRLCRQRYDLISVVT